MTKRKHNPAPLPGYFSRVTEIKTNPIGYHYEVRFRLTPDGEMWHGRGTTPSKAAAIDEITEYRRSTIERERLGDEANPSR